MQGSSLSADAALAAAGCSEAIASNMRLLLGITTHRSCLPHQSQAGYIGDEGSSWLIFLTFRSWQG